MNLLTLLENIADEAIVAANDPDYVEIRRIVGAHDELVAALEMVVDNSSIDDAIAIARAALAKVKP